MYKTRLKADKLLYTRLIEEAKIKTEDNRSKMSKYSSQLAKSTGKDEKEMIYASRNSTKKRVIELQNLTRNSKLKIRQIKLDIRAK
jgi:hypothetical protein